MVSLSGFDSGPKTGHFMRWCNTDCSGMRSYHMVPLFNSPAMFTILLLYMQICSVDRKKCEAKEWQRMIKGVDVELSGTPCHDR